MTSRTLHLRNYGTLMYTGFLLSTVWPCEEGTARSELETQKVQVSLLRLRALGLTWGPSAFCSSGLESLKELQGYEMAGVRCSCVVLFIMAGWGRKPSEPFPFKSSTILRALKIEFERDELGEPHSLQ